MKNTPQAVTTPASKAPVLYVIMREDIQDMNPGKGFAQSAHLGSDFEAAAQKWVRGDSGVDECLNRWRENRNFGTTIAVPATLAQMEEIVENTRFSGLVVDDTYPYRNWYGKMFARPEVTCAFVFVCDASHEGERELLKEFPLHE